MADLIRSVMIPIKDGFIKHAVPAVGADTFYAGAIVYADETTGKAQVFQGAGDKFIGICAEETVADAADVMIPIYVFGLALIAYTSPGQPDVGSMLKMATATDSDNPADLTVGSDAANDIGIGRIVSIEGSAGWVLLQPGLIYVATAGWGG